MPDNRYDQSTRPDVNSNDQATRISTAQQNNGQVQAAQQATAPDLSVTGKQNKSEQEVRRLQNTGQGIGF